MSPDVTTAMPVQAPPVAPAMRPSVPAPAASARPQPEIEVALPKRAELSVNPEETRRNLQDAIQRINDQMQSQRQNLNFHMDESTNRFVITVRNTQSGEVIRQIPDEVVLKVAHNIEQLKGVLHNAVI